MPTVFPTKQSGDILYADDVNAICQAINNLEGAVNLTVGTTQAQIPPANLAGGIPASKLDPASSGTLNNLALSSLTTANLTLTGEGSLGSAGRMIIRNGQGVPILTLGEYDPVNHLHGLQAWDGTKATFRITEAGQVEIQGRIIAEGSGSSFTGTINATNGVFSGDVQVGGPNGVLLRGSTGDIVAGITGRIVGGGVTISNTGITITQGSLNIAGKAIITESGQATFADASITGAVTATSGSIGGISIDSSGIYTGDKGATSGFHIKAAGDVIFSSGTFRGTVQATSGTIEGTLSVSGALQAGANQFSPAGIVIRSGDINLGNGAFVVSPTGDLYATSAEIAGTIHVGAGEVTGTFQVGPNVTLSSQGVQVSGPAGIRVTGTAGIEVTSGSVVVKSADPVPREIVRIGSWLEGSTERRGIRVQDDTRTTFEVLETGQVTVRGAIYADTGEFTGRITAQSGELQNLTVTGNVDVTSGAIRAGTTTLSSAGLSLTQGTINLAGRFVVDEQGRLTATDANLTGAITATSGSIAGDLWIGDGVVLSGTTGQIIAGQTTLSSSGILIRQGTIQLGPNGEFTVTNTGALSATAASIRGHIEATSGAVQGTFTVGGGVALSPSGILVSGESGVRIRGGSLVVRNAADTADIAVLGRYTSPEGISDTGLLLTDGAQSLLRAGQDGTLFVRGTLEATAGAISGDLTVQGRLLADGVLIGSSAIEVFSPQPSAAIPGVGSYPRTEVALGHLADPEVYGLRAGSVVLSSEGLSSPGFRLLANGTFEATSGRFGTTINAVRIDSSGMYHGSAYGATDSKFGISAATGDAYFKGTVAVGNSSEIAGDVLIQPGGKLVVGNPSAKRVEILNTAQKTGLFAYDDQGAEKFAISLEVGGIDIRGAIAVTGGTFSGNVTIGSGNTIRIVGQPPGGVESVHGIYLYEPDPSTKIVRLSFDGLKYSPDGGFTWYPALSGSGITANAITDGTLTITDTTGAADGVLVRRRVNQEAVAMPTDTSYVSLAHKNVKVASVTNTSGTVTYRPGTDYTVNEVDGKIARTLISAIAGGQTVLVTYDWTVVDISSQKGISIYEGALEVTSGVTGQTLISGGYLRVGGLDVGVVQSTNFVTNGDFNQPDNSWGLRQSTGPETIPGTGRSRDLSPPGPPQSWYPANRPFYGDRWMDLEGFEAQYGARAWMPSKSPTAYDAQNHPTGWSIVAFRPGGFMHNRYGYAVLELHGTDSRYAQIEQDIYPFFNDSNGTAVDPLEAPWKEVTFSAAFHWHFLPTPNETITFEVDELVAKFVHVDALRESSFTPVWDEVNETYQGLVYSGGPLDAGDWVVNDTLLLRHPGFESMLPSGDPLQWGATVTSDVPITNAGYVVDNDFVDHNRMAVTQQDGYHHVQLDLGRVETVNHIRVWHDFHQGTIEYHGGGHEETLEGYYGRSHKVEVSSDGVTWIRLFDTTAPITQTVVLKPGLNLLDGAGPWKPGFVTVTSPDGTTTYVEGQDYVVEYTLGGLIPLAIPPGTQVKVTYTNDAWKETSKGKVIRFASRPVRYVRDWLDGYEHRDAQGNVVETFPQSSWTEVEVKHVGIAETNVLGAQVSWTFTSESRSDAYITFVMGPEYGHGDVFIDGVKVGELKQFLPEYVPGAIEIDDIRPGTHTLTIVFPPSGVDDSGVPYDNTGKKLNLDRIKFQDSQLLGPEYTTKTIVASPNVIPPHLFYWAYYSVRPNRAKSYVGHGRSVVVGPFDEPENYRHNSQVRIRYRVRIRAEQTANPEQRQPNQVFVSEVQAEVGPHRTAFRSSLEDRIPGRVIEPFLPDIPGTGIQTYHLADRAVTASKIAPASITDVHIAPGAAIAESKLALNYPTHDHPNKAVLDQITGFGTSGTSTDVARADHLHDDRYYTKAQLQTSGQAQVHWNNVTSKPTEFTPVLASATVRGGVKIGSGLVLGADEKLSVAFAGTGTATTAARSDHVHSYTELTNRPTRVWQVVELTSAIAQNTAYTLPGGMTYTPGSYELAVYLDGRRLIPGHDYQETSPAQVTFLMDIPAGSHLLFDRIPLS